MTTQFTLLVDSQNLESVARFLRFLAELIESAPPTADQGKLRFDLRDYDHNPVGEVEMITQDDRA